MSKEDIITLPSPALRKNSQRIAVINNEIRELAKRMEEATLDWEKSRHKEVGVAMAAVQIGQPRKLIIVRQETGESKEPDFMTLVNPEVVKSEGQVKVEPEGCLSIPDLYGLVPRHNKVKIKAQDIEGRNIRLTAEGFLARILQHEIDHLRGKLFTDRVEDHKYYKIMPDGELEPIKGEELKKALSALEA